MNSLTNYKAVILAGGKATRLYPVTYEIPKPLLPVRKKPIINYLVDLFFGQKIKEIAVLINKDFEEEFNWWKKRYYSNLPAGRKIQILKEEKPLGTLGGLWYLKDWLKKAPFFLSNGDELKKINLAKMTQFHQQKPVLGTIALVKVPNPENYGVMICKKGIIQEFLEKPSPAQILKKTWAGKKSPSKYISSGLYLFSPEVFQYHPGPKFSMVETDLFPKLAKEKKLAGFKFNGKWMDTGTFERYEEALKKWK